MHSVLRSSRRIANSAISFRGLARRPAWSAGARASATRYMSIFDAFLGRSNAGESLELTANELANSVYKLHHKVLAPLNDRCLGPLEKSSHEMLTRPMVFVLGNHSSGKSTFINYVTGRKVYATGVAPTDDGFTIIAPGQEDADYDGPALVGDPDLGFGGLRVFGRELINHVNLKVRTGLHLRDIMVVDSPGMIDSPMSVQGLSYHGAGGHGGAGGGAGSSSHYDYGMDPAGSSLGGAAAEERYSGIRTNASPRDRGYNFPGVVRWFAERADVVLLFFDPDKPGTTGETLACMRAGLAGMEHKVAFVLNKADQFEKVHDFARAYGSLCWNLSKVIPRKDLPLIYTMCVPVDSRGEARIGKLADEDEESQATGGVYVPGEGGADDESRGLRGLRNAMDDLAANRKDIIQSVRKAPMRRVDNLITRLYDNTRMLRMHAQMVEALRSDVRSRLLQWASGGAAVAGLLGVLSGFYLFVGSWETGAPMGLAAAVAVGATYWTSQRALEQHRRYLVEGGAAGLEAMFRKQHFMQLAERDDFVVSLWERVRPQLLATIRTFGLLGLPSVSASELHELDRIAGEEVTRLRRAASKAAAMAVKAEEEGAAGDSEDDPLEGADSRSGGSGAADSDERRR